MDYKNDCEISMEEFGESPESQMKEASLLKAVAATLGVSVTVSSDLRRIIIDYPEPEEYPERYDALVAEIESLVDVIDE